MRLILTLLSCLAANVAAAIPSERLAAEMEIEQDLADWQVDVAAWRVARLMAVAPRDPGVLLIAARVAFYQSDYKRAAELAEASVKAAGGDKDAEARAQSFVDYLAQLQPTWSTFLETRTDHFVIRVTPRDRLLVPYAVQALEGAATAMGEDLGFCPDEPVVVEFYPTRSSFIKASTLTQEEVETSGTVAICHFNRLMVLSPVTMERGYEWMDTICHEYVHYAVYHVAGETVPVWLHEGVAKTLESRWRETIPEPLDPSLASVLAEAREQSRWVTFAEMTPSVAKLPSAGLVTLAFAQVTCGIRMLMKEDGGPEPIRRLLDAVRDSGGDMDGALRSSTGDGLDDFERRVRDHVARLSLARIPGTSFLDESEDSPLRKKFIDGETEKPDPEADARTLADRAARDWVLLGDRFKGRDRLDAALIEYDKALERLLQSQPMVVNRKAHAMIGLGRLDEARRVLEDSLRWYPSLTISLDNLAEIHLRLARAPGTSPESARRHETQALAYSRRSEQINPFASELHVRLAGILTRLGRRSEAEQSRERLETLRRLDQEMP